VTRGGVTAARQDGAAGASAGRPRDQAECRECRNVHRTRQSPAIAGTFTGPRQNPRDWSACRFMKHAVELAHR
jgi:hypothetical protein